ncbi:chromosome-partitioning protein Spo0J [Clostridium puniceum]|uniref:Chromosome-partitioning protein Spo0J n=1 Tax=Clostridium puniceum TaxID=29367 RepID=A0A1S8SYM2_9CLOT|nr:ParB N-terminal domain-containing protein [Clostridium puniceum]OOM70588.1 chromosome-partitioning protein Spo0J [Clostridium puniceum]
MSEKKLMSLADMFGENSVEVESKNQIEAEISKLIPFEKHPFKLYEGERFDNMVESIRELGVIVPIIVRSKGEFYEILSGHNRANAAKTAGLKKVPVIIKENLEDEEAMLIVTETNLMQRSFSDMLHSERAAALSEHHKALSSQGKRSDILKEIEAMLKADEIKNEETSRQVGEKLTSADETGKNYNLSGRTVSRYLRICNLIKGLLDKLDIGEIPFTACVELSYLTEEEQHIVNDIVAGTKFKIDIKKAESLRKFSEKKNLNQETAHSIISGEINKKQKSNKSSMVKLKPKLINKYFSSEVKQVEIEDIIDKALKLYFDTQRKNK